MLTKEEIIVSLKDIGIEKGDILHLKVSMRALGKVQGGADTLLNALLEVVGTEGTLVSDTFVKTYNFPLKEDLINYLVDDSTPTYAGALASVMLKHPENVRSKHPIQKFSAIGAKAEELMLSHTDKSFAYQPLKDMALKKAKNLTIGKKVNVGATPHVAVHELGFQREKPNRGVVYKDSDGDLKIFRVNWNGGCARGFPKFIPLYKETGALIKEGMIGNAECFLTDMQKTLEIEIEKLKEEPSFFFCNDPACKSCRLSWEHSTGNRLSVFFHLGLNRFRKITKF